MKAYSCALFFFFLTSNVDDTVLMCVIQMPSRHTCPIATRTCNSDSILLFFFFLVAFSFYFLGLAISFVLYLNHLDCFITAARLPRLVTSYSLSTLIDSEVHLTIDLKCLSNHLNPKIKTKDKEKV